MSARRCCRRRRSGWPPPRVPRLRRYPRLAGRPGAPSSADEGGQVDVVLQPAVLPHERDQRRDLSRGDLAAIVGRRHRGGVGGTEAGEWGTGRLHLVGVAVGVPERLLDRRLELLDGGLLLAARVL